MADIKLTVPDDKAERFIQALERASCTDVIECVVDEYRKRILAAFARHCPDRPYTGSPLDVDTLMAFLEVKLSKVPHRRADDPLEKP